MLTFEEVHAERMKDPEFRREYDALEDWGKQIQAEIDARIAREARRRAPETVAEKVPVRRAF
jgi:hypothetical protein